MFSKHQFAVLAAPKYSYLKEEKNLQFGRTADAGLEKKHA